MEKLDQITIDNSLNVTVNCQVDQSLLAKNFMAIVNALKELQKAQSLSEQKIQDLSSLKDMMSNLNQKMQSIQKSKGDKPNSVVEVPKLGTHDTQVLSNNLSSLTKRVEKNEANILDNIKDINLINSDVRDAKKDIEQLKAKLSLFGASTTDKGEKNEKESSGYGINQIASNLNKQLKKSQESMNSLIERLSAAEGHIKRLDEELKLLRQQQSGSNSNNTDGKTSSNLNGVSDREFQDLKKDLRDKIDVLNKRVSILQTQTDHHDQEIAYLKDLIGQEKDKSNKGQKEKGEITSQTKNLTERLQADLSKLKKRLEEVDVREKKDYKDLLEQINNLKQQLKQLKSEKIESKTSLEEENNRSHRKLTINKDKDELNDKVNQLSLKVLYLQKMIAGSKNSLSDQKNPEKLPTIHRPKRRDPNLTGFQDREKDRSGISRKDLAELKAELEAWLKSLIDGIQNRENYENMQLRLQELRKNLDKKADGEGTKKGFSFLQNKITQLYLFLTEPETEDAMIVRKGFNCLSCSKKVEKLRGKLGPRINWNNMTTTNYTPPKVGYSKPMGEREMDKQDDL